MSRSVYASLFLLLCLVSSWSFAQGSIRADVFKSLEKAKVAQDENRIDDAFAILDRLKQRSGRKALQSYELVQLHNFYAYAWLAKENYPKALVEFQQVLQQEKVPDGIVAQTRMTMAQLYLATDQPGKSITLLKQWIAAAEKPNADAYVLMSQAYLQKKQVSEALSPLLKGFKVAKQQGRKEKENWYALLQYIYSDKQDFNNQEKALEVLVDRWPKAQWWLALGGVYAQQEKELKQLYAMDAAYQQGLFSRGEYIVSMSQLLAMQGAPYYAAKAMTKGLDDGFVEPSFKNHRRLGSYYQRAQEQSLALKYFQKASAQADDGEISLRIAYVYMNQYDYPNAEKFIQKALAQGSLQNTTKAQLLLGEVQFHRQKFDNAISQFDRVLVANKNYTDDKKRVDQKKKRNFEQAQRWLRHVKNEQSQQQELAIWLKENTQ